MYKNIVNPITNEKGSIFSVKGQNLLNEYLIYNAPNLNTEKLLFDIKLFINKAGELKKIKHKPMYLYVSKNLTLKQFFLKINHDIKVKYKVFKLSKLIIDNKIFQLSNKTINFFKNNSIEKFFNTKKLFNLRVIVFKIKHTNKITNFCNLNPYIKYDMTVYSADYDGCWDILFGPIRRLIEKNINNGHKRYTDTRIKLENNIRFFYKQASKSLLMVGSARQSINMDEYNRNIHCDLHKKMGIKYKKNEGYCLQDFTRLCKINNWDLLRFLYPDISKASYGNIAKNIHNDIINIKKGDYINPKLVWNNPEIYKKRKTINKSEIISSQINILKTLYPKKKIIYIFYDDDSSDCMFSNIISKLKKIKIPSNIKIKLYRYNWYNIIYNKGDITEIKYNLKEPMLNHIF